MSADFFYNLQEHKIYGDPTFWVAVSFSVFVVLAIWKGRKIVISMLDARINQIAKDLKEAEKLKSDAEAFLQQAKAKLKESEDLVKEIKTQTEMDNNRSLQQAKGELADLLNRKEKQLAERLSQDEEKLVRDLTRDIALNAILEATNILKTELSEKQSKKAKDLFEKNINELSALKKLH